MRAEKYFFEEQKMTNNQRVVLTADLIEAAEKSMCKIPKETVKAILDADENRKVFRTDTYKNVTQVISNAKKLIKRRIEARAELHI